MLSPDRQTVAAVETLPQPTIAAVRGMSGRQFPDAMLRGEPPLPPICHLTGFSLDRIEDGRPNGSACGAAIRERNL
jgi:hypothetical protein